MRTGRGMSGRTASWTTPFDISNRHSLKIKAILRGPGDPIQNTFPLITLCPYYSINLSEMHNSSFLYNLSFRYTISFWYKYTILNLCVVIQMRSAKYTRTEMSGLHSKFNRNVYIQRCMLQNWLYIYICLQKYFHDIIDQFIKPDGIE